MVPDLDAEKGWGGLEKQKFFGASDCQRTEDVLRAMGPWTFWGYGGVTAPIWPDT